MSEHPSPKSRNRERRSSWLRLWVQAILDMSELHLDASSLRSHSCATSLALRCQLFAPLMVSRLEMYSIKYTLCELRYSSGRAFGGWWLPAGTMTMATAVSNLKLPKNCRRLAFGCIDANFLRSNDRWNDESAFSNKLKNCICQKMRKYRRRIVA